MKREFLRCDKFKTDAFLDTVIKEIKLPVPRYNNDGFIVQLKVIKNKEKKYEDPQKVTPFLWQHKTSNLLQVKNEKRPHFNI